MHHHHHLSTLVLHAVLGLALVSHAAGQCSSYDQVTVQLQYILQPQFAGYVAAQNKGYYEEACLQVEVVPGGIGVDVEGNVASGRAQFAARWGVEAFKARETFAHTSTSGERVAGADYRIVAQWFQRPALRGIAMADSNIGGVEDYAGKSVSFWAFAATEVITAMSLAGISLDDVTVRPKGFTVSDVLPGSSPGVDVAHGMLFNEVGQLLATVNEETGDLFRRKDFTYIEFNNTAMLQDGLSVDRSWLESDERNVDVTRRFVKAVLRGWLFCRDEPADCANMFYSGAQQGGPHAEFMMAEVNKLIWPSPLGIGLLDRDDLVRTMDLSREYGGVNNTVAYDDMFSNEFITSAHGDLDAAEDLIGADFEPVSYEFCLDSRTNSFHICTGRENEANVVVAEANSSLMITIVSGAILVVLLVLGLAFYFVRRARTVNRNWMINLEELTFGEEIGRGAFATVFKGVYRESAVAIKKLSFSGDSGDNDSNASLVKSNPKSKSIKLHQSTVTPSSLENGRSNSSAFKYPNHSSNGTRRKASRRAKAFHEEVARVALLRHPHTLFMYGAAVDGDAGYLVTELAEGGTVHDLLHNITVPMTWRQRVELALGMARGMVYLHTQNLLHGDIKTSNLLLDRNLSVKVADFSMDAAGTLPWMAPERLRGEPMNKASDVWSAGIVMWELATRKDPFATWTSDDIRQRVGTNGETPDLDVGGPSTYLQVMRRMLSLSPDSRPAFADIAAELEAILTEQSAELDRLDGEDVTSQTSHRNELFEAVYTPAEQAMIAHKGTPEPKHFENLVVLFADIVGFTDLSAKRHATEVADMLDRLFAKFDALCHQLDVTAIETIGDAYIACGGIRLNENHKTSATRVCQMASRMVRAAQDTPIDTKDPNGPSVSIRVGIHMGPAVGTLVGRTVPKFTLLGDTVNLAARMETSSEPDRIAVTKVVLQAIDGIRFSVTARPSMEIKGKGALTTYFVQESSA